MTLENSSVFIHSENQIARKVTLTVSLKAVQFNASFPYPEPRAVLSFDALLIIEATYWYLFIKKNYVSNLL